MPAVRRPGSRPDGAPAGRRSVQRGHQLEAEVVGVGLPAVRHGAQRRWGRAPAEGLHAFLHRCARSPRAPQPPAAVRSDPQVHQYFAPPGSLRAGARSAKGSKPRGKVFLRATCLPRQCECVANRKKKRQCTDAAW